MMLLVTRCLLLVSCLQVTLQASAQPAACTLDWLRAHLNVREATGRNDGPAVAAIVRAGGGNPLQRPEWCGFTQTAANRACGLPYPANGMQGAAAAWFRPGPRLVYQLGTKGSLDSLKPGYKAGLWYGTAVHHITCLAVEGRPTRRGRAARGWYCLGGNEGRGAEAGLHYTFYSSGSLFAVSNWTY